MNQTTHRYRAMWAGRSSPVIFTAHDTEEAMQKAMDFSKLCRADIQLYQLEPVTRVEE